jgi:hypothetical protein
MHGEFHVTHWTTGDICIRGKRPQAGATRFRHPQLPVARNAGYPLKSTTRLLLLLFLLAAATAGAVELVANRSVTTSSLSPSQVRAIFNMRLLQWPDGTPIRVFVLPDRNPVHRRFCKEYLGVFPHQLRYAWNRRVYSGMGQSPQQVDDVQEMHDRIAETPGAIGYLPEDLIDDSVRRIEMEME